MRCCDILIEMSLNKLFLTYDNMIIVIDIKPMLYFKSITTHGNIKINFLVDKY